MKSFVKGLKSGFSRVGTDISAVVNAILLSVVYVVGVGLSSLFARLSGKHQIELTKKKGSYWKDLELSEEHDSFHRQF